MASALGRRGPPSTLSPKPPTIIAPEDDKGNLDATRVASLSGDPFLSPSALTASGTASQRSPGLLHSPGGSPLLHPQWHLLRPPTPTFAMSDDAAEAAPGAQALPGPSPFNFKTQFISTSPVKSNIGQRRGHRYKHSSISAQHQIFQEPPPRPPPVLPASLPIPTLREAWASMQRDQRARLYWCCCHAAVAVYVFFRAGTSLAATALSHLVFFDVGSAAVCVAIDVLGNFDVWRRSTIRHPFGLQRAEVLAGFAMSVFLVFGGFDLLSHELKHVLEGVGGHAPHHPPNHPPHHHDSPQAGAIDAASLAAVASTLISAYGLRNHGRIRKVMRVPLPLPWLARLLPAFADGGMGVLTNPFHFLTLFFSFLMLVLPLMGIGPFLWLDRAICAAIAVSMFVLGSRLAVAQGLILLMSYSERKSAPAPSSSCSQPPPSKTDSGASPSDSLGDTRSGRNRTVSAVVCEIEAEPQVSRVEEAQFWQVHYGLAMANLRVRVVRGCDDTALSRLRARVSRLVNNRLGEGYGRGAGLRWEVTVQTSAEL
ncbi:hypothetical protein VTK73DRAFT_10232 [Phialemonium thermophilum]|uniref:Zinc transporter n=1 Tax=Phialemonium thermophilum TaxID=223376 RepID=A0ABR3XHU0_9PEZI